MKATICPRAGLRSSVPALLLCCLALMLAIACGQVSTTPPEREPTPQGTTADTPGTAQDESRVIETDEEATQAPSTAITNGEVSLVAPTGTPSIAGIHIYLASYHPPSIEEQILTSSTIVRATLQSVTADTEVIPSGAGVAPIYGAVQKLRFNIHEYLKGAGPGQADIIVRGYDTYPDEAMASQVAQAVMANRVTTWDDQEAVLFLNATTPPQTGAQPAQVASNGATFEFTTSNYSVQSDWDYSIDTLSRAWLPAVGSQTPAQQPSGQTGTGAGSQSAPAASFITDGSLSPTPATSIDELRSKIAEITAMENVSSSYEYAVCLDNKIKRERYFRDEPVIDWEIEDSIESGSAPGSTIHTAEFTSGGPEYYIPWVNGPDAALFKTSIEDDDSDPTNGSEYALTIARPLPAGQYRVFHHMQHWENVICDFWPDNVYDDWTITVTAPGGTLHEALFDPVATGLATGVEGGSGSLDPAGFTVDNTAVTITKLLWQAGSVILTMSPFNPLAGHSIEFIDIDGAVSLTLNMGDATADRAAGTLTWTVTKKPWKGADQLMLRISKP